jgi:hypothetical protein
VNNPSKGTIVPLSVMPTFIEATIWLREGERAVSIYRSVAVTDTDTCMEPVFDYLHEVCFLPGTTETVSDETMMFGEAEHTIHLLLGTCPGTVVPHNCHRVRMGKVDTKGMAA